MVNIGALTTALGAVDALLARAIEETPIEVLASNLRSAVSEMEVDRSSIPMTANLLEEGNITSPEALACAKGELTAFIAVAAEAAWKTAQPKPKPRPASRSQERRMEHQERRTTRERKPKDFTGQGH